MNQDRITTLYSGRATNWLALGLSTALVVPLLVMGAASKDAWSTPAFVVPVALATLVAVFNLLTLSSVRTLAGPNGVTVHFGALGWPHYHYPLAKIQDMAAVQIPYSRSAWGIMWSPRRGLMLTVRSGPAIQLTLTNNKKVTISTPHPEHAIQAIAALTR